MTTYRVTSVNATDWTEEIEADSIDEAIEKSSGGGYLCHQCASERNDGDWEPVRVSDIDGNEGNVSRDVPRVPCWTIPWTEFGDAGCGEAS